jgi:hypothetical protein
MAAVPLRSRLSMILRMINTSDISRSAKRKGVYLIGSQGDLSAGAGTTRTMIDKDEGEQCAAAGEIRPMLSIKQVLALIPFSRATLYREMEAAVFPPLKRCTSQNCLVQG